MRFRDIGTYAASYSTALPDNVRMLVEDFGVTRWGHAPNHMSELERVLRDGESRARYGDFAPLVNLRVFDHTCVFGCGDGMTFLVTMPYANALSFAHDFAEFMDGYRTEKRERAGEAMYEGDAWADQMQAHDGIAAAFLDDDHKPRSNGDLAAVVATRETLARMGLTVAAYGGRTWR